MKFIKVTDVDYDSTMYRLFINVDNIIDVQAAYHPGCPDESNTVITCVDSNEYHTKESLEEVMLMIEGK